MTTSPLPWLSPGDPFPPTHRAWGARDPVPGLLAAGGALDVDHLRRAYAQGVFPWFSEGQPILWWSTDPRMVLRTDAFRMHRSLRQTLKQFLRTPGCEVRIDSAFERVIHACSTTPREGQDGTWIVPEMIEAYCAMHREGLAHSVETWMGGELVGGLYCVALGQAVFGESMFAWRSNASKIALSALVAFCRVHGIGLIDCQQNTAHLASLGAFEIPREAFLAHVVAAQQCPAPLWRFDPIYWNAFLGPSTTAQ